MTRKDGTPRSLPTTLGLDPLPWSHTACGYDWCDDFGGRFSFNNGIGNEFAPRPGYSQNREDYA